MTEQEPYAVLGATGKQGSAVVDALLAGGHPVRAVVRDPGSPRVAALRERGVEVALGDQDDPDSLVGPLTGVAAAFLMTTYTDGSGTDGEVRRGTALAEAAARAGTPRVVYSSVGGADRDSGIPHFESKRLIEERLQGLLPTRVVRPTFFMDNLAGLLDAARDGDGEVVLALPMPGDVPLQMVATRDIGRVAAAALLDPDALGGDSLEIAGDELTCAEVAERIGRHLGRPTRFEQAPADGLDDDLAAMWRWFVETPAYRADLARTRALVPDALDLAGWLAARDD